MFREFVKNLCDPRPWTSRSTAFRDGCRFEGCLDSVLSALSPMSHQDVHTKAMHGNIPTWATLKACASWRPWLAAKERRGDDVGRPMLRGSPWTWWMKDWSSTQDEALQWQSSFLRITWLHWSPLDCMSNEPWCLPLFVWVCVSMFAWRCLDNWTNLGGLGRMTQILKTCKLQLHVSSPSVMKTAKQIK